MKVTTRTLPQHTPQSKHGYEYHYVLANEKAIVMRNHLLIHSK